jgi:hypothetical protein
MPDVYPEHFDGGSPLNRDFKLSAISVLRRYLRNLSPKELVTTLETLDEESEEDAIVRNGVVIELQRRIVQPS